MNQLETKFYELVPYILGEISTQLKIMNKLKALELKAKSSENNITPEMLDDIMEG